MMTNDDKVRLVRFTVSAVAWCAAVAFGIWLGVSQAFAQNGPPCGSRAEAVAALGGKYGEAPRFVGMGNGVVVEVWLNPETGTWTLLANRPDGVACMLANGNAGEMVDPPVPGEDS